MTFCFLLQIPVLLSGFPLLISKPHIVSQRVHHSEERLIDDLLPAIHNTTSLLIYRASKQQLQPDLTIIRESQSRFFPLTAKRDLHISSFLYSRSLETYLHSQLWSKTEKVLISSHFPAVVLISLTAEQQSRRVYVFVDILSIIHVKKHRLDKLDLSA